MDAFFRDLQFKLKKKSKHQPGENSCVLWTGNVSYSGYGLQSVKWPVEGRKLEKAHRVALMVERGLTRSQFRDVEGEVSHLCHNKLCVNTAHLVIEQHWLTRSESIASCRGAAPKPTPRSVLCKPCYLILVFGYLCSFIIFPTWK